MFTYVKILIRKFNLEFGFDFKVDPALHRGLEYVTSGDTFQPGSFYDSESARFLWKEYLLTKKSQKILRFLVQIF